MNDFLVLVTGATGNQGGAVTQHLTAHGVRVRALTRNAVGPATERLRRTGVQIAVGDLNDPASLDRALVGVDAVFSVQDFWAKGAGFRGEVQQGIHLAEAAKRANVSHFVQSGMAQGKHIDGIEHFESKQAIVEHVKTLRLPYTVVGTVYFMDNLLDPKRGGGMTFPTLTGTLKASTKMHMLALDDLGAIVAHILMHREPYLARCIDVASDCLTVPEMKQIYRRVSGSSPKAWSIPAWALRLINKDFARQLAWQNSPGWTFSLDESRAIHPGLTTFEAFLSRHRIRHL